jgi:pteridine reductase
MKLALITAGYRRLGAAIATRLAGAGWTLALHSRKATTPDDDLAAALTQHGTTWKGFEADLSDDSAVMQLIPAVFAHYGRAPDLLVNNASLFDWDNPASVTPQAIAAHMNVNLTAPVLLTTSLAQYVEAGQQAAVVNILDQRIKQPNGDQLSYTLSKQALAGATETLARALAPKVRVNAVAPGLTLATDEYAPGQMERIAAMMPLGVLPTPGDIADAVFWLANAPATTGQTIFVDGGANLKSFDRDFLFL